MARLTCSLHQRAAARYPHFAAARAARGLTDRTTSVSQVAGTQRQSPTAHACEAGADQTTPGRHRPTGIAGDPNAAPAATRLPRRTRHGKYPFRAPRRGRSRDHGGDRRDPSGGETKRLSRPAVPTSATWSYPGSWEPPPSSGSRHRRRPGGHHVADQCTSPPKALQPNTLARPNNSWTAPPLMTSHLRPTF